MAEGWKNLPLLPGESKEDRMGRYYTMQEETTDIYYKDGESRVPHYSRDNGASTSARGSSHPDITPYLSGETRQAREKFYSVEEKEKTAQRKKDREPTSKAKRLYELAEKNPREQRKRSGPSRPGMTSEQMDMGMDVFLAAQSTQSELQEEEWMAEDDDMGDKSKGKGKGKGRGKK